MDIKGQILLSRKQALIDEFGEPRWKAFYEALAQFDPFFLMPLLAGTNVPREHFLRYNDAIINTFYKGDKRAYIGLGAQSGRRFLSGGPYQKVLTGQDPATLLGQASRLLSLLYTGTSINMVVDNDRGRARYDLVNYGAYHPYFELVSVGYFSEFPRSLGKVVGEHELLNKDPIGIGLSWA